MLTAFTGSQLVAVIVSSAPGVLSAGFKKIDLFGVIIIAVASGPGGGSLRDILTNEPPLVFHSPLYTTVSWLGLCIFIARLIAL